MSKIAFVTMVKALPGKRDLLAQYIKSQVPLFLKAESGTLRLDVLIPGDEPDSVVVWEVYESPEALETHRNGETLKRFVEGGSGLLDGWTSRRHTLVE